MNERSIFVEALERDDPSERAAYLNKACRGDAALRKRIEKLLRSYIHAENFLESPPDVLIATIVGGEWGTFDEVARDILGPSGKAGCLGTLGQYEVVEVIGQGGMGIVMRAYDTKLNRVVAIKAIAPELVSNPMAVKRFLREARAAAAVNHDHVVTIHAIHDESHPPYIVMEYIEGPSLQEKIERSGCLELKEVLRIGMQAAAGLAAAHEQGLVHRDVKPANILLENGVERVKITDFGLARAVDDVSMTQPGLIAGTPQYMSPEQAQGQGVDHRSDLFSLGSVLYTMCTGRPPFQADTSIAMLRAVLEDTPRSIREITPETPAWLEEIIARLLAKHPDHRFHSARAVSELLGKWLSHVQSPQVHEAPIRSWRDKILPNPFLRTVSPFWTRVPFTLLLALHLLCIAGFAAILAIEVELVLLAGPVCSLLGLAVAVAGWMRSRSVLAVVLGLSTVLCSLLITAIIVFFDLSPGRAQGPVSWLIVVYELFAIPLGIVAMLTSHLDQPKEGWLRLLRFNLRTLLGLMMVAAISFAAIRLAINLSYVGDSDSPIALAIGIFVATVFALGWTMWRIVRQNVMADLGEFQDDRAPFVNRRFRRTVGILIAATLSFVAAGCLLLWELERTSYGYVVFKSPVSDIAVERIRNSRVARVYDTLHGGGTRWHVPVGVWEFRIQGNRSDYRLHQSKVDVRRGSSILLEIVPTEPLPIEAQSAGEQASDGK